MFAGAHVVLASEALLMAKKAGIDMASYFDAVRNSAGNSCESPSLLPTSKPARGMLCDMHTRRNTTHTLSRLLAMGCLADVWETEVPLILNQTFDPGFHIDLHNKDWNLGYEMGRKFGVPLVAFGVFEQT
jgi:3-hydroxyisobutyrate dehydrogenase-like beta-hydroxyacid dehydrogenase